MSDTKHKEGEAELSDDLDRDPGIGQSKGSFMTGKPPLTIKGENSVEGDVENDSTAGDGVPEGDRERANG